MASSRQKTTDSWTDSIGQTFKPGDLIGVASISSRSPQLVVARVERINLTNPQGEPHVTKRRTGRKVKRTTPRTRYVGPPLGDMYAPGIVDMQARRAVMDRNEKLQLDPANYERYEHVWEVDELEDVQQVTVTALPLHDGRGFRRTDHSRKWTYDEKTGKGKYVYNKNAQKIKAVTYTIIGNIIKLPDTITEETIMEFKEKTADV